MIRSKSPCQNRQGDFVDICNKENEQKKDILDIEIGKTLESAEYKYPEFVNVKLLLIMDGRR